MQQQQQQLRDRASPPAPISSKNFHNPTKAYVARYYQTRQKFFPKKMIISSLSDLCMSSSSKIEKITKRSMTASFNTTSSIGNSENRKVNDATTSAPPSIPSTGASTSSTPKFQVAEYDNHRNKTEFNIANGIETDMSFPIGFARGGQGEDTQRTNADVNDANMMNTDDCPLEFVSLVRDMPSITNTSPSSSVESMSEVAGPINENEHKHFSAYDSLDRNQDTSRFTDQRKDTTNHLFRCKPGPRSSYLKKTNGFESPISSPILVKKDVISVVSGITNDSSSFLSQKRKNLGGEAANHEESKTSVNQAGLLKGSCEERPSSGASVRTSSIILKRENKALKEVNLKLMMQFTADQEKKKGHEQFDLSEEVMRMQSENSVLRKVHSDLLAKIEDDRDEGNTPERISQLQNIKLWEELERTKFLHSEAVLKVAKLENINRFQQSHIESLEEIVKETNNLLNSHLDDSGREGEK